MKECWWDDIANQGIIGLGPPPWNLGTEDWFDWPTGGYDEALFGYKWDRSGALEQSGQTKEEWVELADEMIARWTAWKTHVLTLEAGK